MVEQVPVKDKAVGSSPTAGVSDTKSTHYLRQRLLFKSIINHLLTTSSTHSIVFMGADPIKM